MRLIARVGAIEFIHRKLVGLRDAGCAVLLVSAELEEVTALADRLMVVYEGRVVGEVDRWEGHDPEVLKRMLDRLALLREQGLDLIED